MISPIVPLAGATWVVAQSIKFVMERPHHPDSHFTDSGGMPSAHAAVTAAATTAIGFESGVGSSLFALAFLLTAIVAHDAYRVRWALGEQAVRLNELSAAAVPARPPLAVWRGHRIREVAAGLALGILIGGVYGLAS